MKKAIKNQESVSGKSKSKKTSTPRLQRIKSQMKVIKRKVKNTIKRKVSLSYAKKKKAEIKKPALKEALLSSSPQSVTVNEEKEMVEISKFVATAKPDYNEETKEFNLPYKYYDNRITLLARDPWWIHTYWDISEEKISEVISSIPGQERENLKWTLRVYDVSGIKDFQSNSANGYFDIDINFEVNNWYINVNNPEREWCVEIGLKTLSGKFFPVARSNRIKTPYFGISDVLDAEWILPDDEYFKVLGVYDLGRSSLERRKKLQELIKYQISSGAFSPGISSISSAMVGGKKPRQFFLEVWTELILYGRTHADANVEVEGKKVKLKSDGTFSLRYALPEGNFQYKVVAVSKDKKDRRKVVPAVKRYTKK
ncbi:MAG: DUF4912 domain-containing protein [Candidatus Omnitrophica bacterium]|nr:DUF4912 domain-containing protein [Candidatus Omnitrophota bacterium]